MKKRMPEVLALLIALLMTVGLFPTSAFAEPEDGSYVLSCEQTTSYCSGGEGCSNLVAEGDEPDVVYNCGGHEHIHVEPDCYTWVASQAVKCDGLHA